MVSTLPPTQWSTNSISGAALADDSVVVPEESLKWTSEDQKRLKRQQHRAYMVGFRLKKKQTRILLQAERERLEHQMKWYMAVVQGDAFPGSSLAIAGKRQGVAEALQKLVVLSEKLTNQNVALRVNIGRYEGLEMMLRDHHHPAIEEEVPAVLEREGWWVHFSKGEPSFFFHPFSRVDVDTQMSAIPPKVPSDSSVWNFLGWKVSRVLMASDVLWDTERSLRVQFTKRLQCAINFAVETTCAQAIELTPLITTPDCWGCHERSQVDTQVLQTFSPDCRVEVVNVPGSIHLRYLCLHRRSQWILASGKRKLVFNLDAIDSKANERRRNAEFAQDNVEWIVEGGAVLTLRGRRNHN